MDEQAYMTEQEYRRFRRSVVAAILIMLLFWTFVGLSVLALVGWV